ncbi:unnamed protein product [Prunus armeniaca]
MSAAASMLQLEQWPSCCSKMSVVGDVRQLEQWPLVTGPAPNFPEPETNPAETPASHPYRVHSLKLCPLLPKRIKGTRLSAEISAEPPL